MRTTAIVTALLLGVCTFFAGRFLGGPIWWLGFAVIVSVPFSVRARKRSLSRPEQSVAYLASLAGLVVGYFTS